MTTLDLQFALYQNKRAVIEAIRDGADAVDTLHTPTLGPVSADRIDYPYAEVLPETTDYQSGNEYAHTVRLNCYFERTGDTDDYLLMLATAFDAIKQAVDDLSEVSCVVSYRPETIEDYAGELNGTLLVLISTQLRVTTLVDLADL